MVKERRVGCSQGKPLGRCSHCHGGRPILPALACECEDNSLSLMAQQISI